MKTLSILLLCLPILCTCNTKVKEENTTLLAKIERLRTENDSLIRGNKHMITSIDSYQKTIFEIDQNLAVIDEEGLMLKKLTPEGQEVIHKDIKESIKQHIFNISALLDNSRLKIISLDKNLNSLRKEAGGKSEEILALDNKIQELSNLILMKEQEISDLEEALEDKIDFLRMVLDIEKERTAKVHGILNRAYYITGTSKDLKELGIIKKEGGFIGIGQVKVLNATAPNSLFIEIKKDQTDLLDLQCKKATLITSHPKTSYSFQGDVDAISGLLIEDSQEFWRNSNYLVIEVRN